MFTKNQENKKFFIPLENYRLHSFQLFGKDIQVGGMAGPHRNVNIDSSVIYLRDRANRMVLIGLCAEKNFTEISSGAAMRHGLEYYHFPVQDFSENIVPARIYDNIYNTVKKATEEGKQVTIHCNMGNGRTGTALAALKLHELIERDVKEKSSNLNEGLQSDSSVYVFCDDWVGCTSLVKEAVDSIRRDRKGMDHRDSGSYSVETDNDVNTLVAYEKHLRLLMQKENREKDYRSTSFKV